MAQRDPVRHSTTSRKDESSASIAGTWSGPRKVLLGFVAAGCFLLGLLGIALPLLPTTPFLLLMSYCLLRVSPKLHRRVAGWPVVGRHLRAWEQQRGVTRGTKRSAYITVAVVVGLTLLFNPFGWLGGLTLGSLAMVGIYVVYRLPTIEPDTQPRDYM